MVILDSAANAVAAEDAPAAVPTATNAPPTVNVVIRELADRLRSKDPTLSTVSLRRLPLADITPSEVLYILQALLETSGTTKSSNNNNYTMTMATTPTCRGATMEFSDDDDNDNEIAPAASSASEPSYENNDDDDEESLACPISTLQMWLPDHPSNNNNSNHNNSSSRMLMSEHSGHSHSNSGSVSFNSSFTDSNDGDFLLVLNNDGSSEQQQQGNLLQMMQNLHDSWHSMDWERGNASNITGMMSSVEEEEGHDIGDDDEDIEQHAADDETGAVVVEDDDDDETASAMMDPLERVLLQEVQPAPAPAAPAAQVPPQQQQRPTLRRVPVPDYSIITPALANNTSITTLAVSSAASSAAWKALFCGIGQNSCIQTLELGDPCLIADPCTLETDACKALAEEVLLAKRRTRRTGSENGNNTSNDNINVDSCKATSSLQRLVLRSFSLPFQGVEYLARGFENNKSSLESVELQQIETDPGSFGRILESLASPSSTVKSVILVDCDLGIDMLLDDHPLTLLLSTSRSLETLRMTECQVTSVELQAMAAATPPPASVGVSLLRPPLKVLDLRGNELGNDAAPALAAFLDKQTSLEKLILEDNQLGDDAVIQYLAAPLARHPSLRKLNMRGNGLTSKSVSRSVVLPATLEVLDLSENLLGGAAPSSSSIISNTTSDWIGFFQGNSHRTTSWSLVLEATSLTDIDLVQLCQGLEESSTCSLQSLNVSQNDFGKRGMQAVTKLLLLSSLSSGTTTTTKKMTTMIQSLNLSACHLTDEHMAILAPPLTRCASLRRVYLGFNQIGNAGCQSLGMALAEKKCGIQELQLQFNSFGPTGLNHLVQGVKQNVRLHYLSVLKDSGMECDRTKQLQHWLALNRAGRQALSCSCALPTAIWSTILARAGRVYGPTACYYLLQEESSRMAS
jgi:Ran GTPase-activating protein (RanGAP) involved in mRNA processing and transport